MKKLLTLLILIGLGSAGIASATLFNYYSEQGQKLPSVTERIVDATRCGIDDYRGTEAQNEALEACLIGTSKINNTLPYFQKLGEGLLGSNNINFVQVQNLYLSGSGISSSVTSVGLTSFDFPNGNNVSITDFGDIGYGVLEPDSPREENISFTGITQNANGTATLTGVSRGLGLSYPYTASTTLRFAHAGGSLFRISNTAPFYNEFNIKSNDETITGNWIFSLYPKFTTTTTLPTLGAQFATKYYVDNVGAGGFTANNIGDGQTIRVRGTAPETFDIATSTDNRLFDFILNANREFTISTTTASKMYYFWNDRYNATTTKESLTLTDFASSTVALNTQGTLHVGGNATTTQKMSVNQLCYDGINCRPSPFEMLAYASSTNNLQASADTEKGGSGGAKKQIYLYNHRGIITLKFDHKNTLSNPDTATVKINDTMTSNLNITSSNSYIPAVININLNQYLPTSTNYLILSLFTDTDAGYIQNFRVYYDYVATTTSNLIIVDD